MIIFKRYQAIMRELADIKHEIKQKRCSELYRAAPMNFGNLLEQMRGSDFSMQITTNNVKARLYYPDVYQDVYLASFAFSYHELSRLLASPEWEQFVRFLNREFGLQGETQYTREVLQKILSEPDRKYKS